MDNFNDGRHKSFFCVAVNLLDLQDIKSVIKNIGTETTPDLTVKEKSAVAAKLFQTLADQKEISLKLRKKVKK